jgi:hypothetical protein
MLHVGRRDGRDRAALRCTRAATKPGAHDQGPRHSQEASAGPHGRLPYAVSTL